MSEQLAPRVADWLGLPAHKPSRQHEHVVSPAATIERVRPHARALGITRLADITGLDTIGIPVATAYRPNARSLSVSQGKGTTPDAARASALMEAVEFAHAERPRLALRLDRVADVTGRYVDPRHLPHRDGAVVGDDRPLLWAAGISLFDGGDVVVPFDAVHLDQTTVAAGDYLPITSNGLASGNDRAEAVVHALCELIERDATRLWELAAPERQLATRIDPSTVRDADCRALLDRCDAAGLEVALSDLASDLEVPVVLAQITARRADPFRPIAAAAGIGCHLHPAAALRRALTEAAQTRLIDIAGARDDLEPARYARALDDDPLLHRLPALPASASQFPGYAGAVTDTAVGDAAHLIATLRDAGLEPVVVDLADEAIGIPVVRVVVGGLEGLPAMMTGHDEVLGARGLAAVAS